MSGIMTMDLRDRIAAIVREYLLNVSTLRNHDYFGKSRKTDSRTKFYKNTGFSLLLPQCGNKYIVNEEVFLEGCTRVFLINPIFKILMDAHGIENDWQYGNTYADYEITNREYELGSYVEFIAVLEKKHTGIRYTKSSYSSTETCFIDRDARYLYGTDNVPGYDKLSHIDEVLVLDWSGIPEDELTKKHPSSLRENQLVKTISVEEFFRIYFLPEEYEFVIHTAISAMAKAKEIIALSAVPQLLPGNMLRFKSSLLNDFAEENVEHMEYELKNGSALCISDEADIERIKNAFFKEGYGEAIIGNADFAKSFITSEYLFRTVYKGLSIDYTSVVVGYLKSVEQLLYWLYLSAFEGASSMFYWDRVKDVHKFDESIPSKYRYDPYNIDKNWMQEYSIHRKKTGIKAPEIGELVQFLRYYKRIWRISENGKEIVYSCLDDFRSSCRNSHFHKDNIGLYEYATVERIRKNAQVCIYYLLGGFKLLDTTTTIKEQLSIVDYRFEYLYQEIFCKRSKHFKARFSDGEEVVICYLNNDVNAAFNETGILPNAQLRFVNTGLAGKDIYLSDINRVMEDAAYIRENTISITRTSMPTEIIAFLPKKQKASR